MTVKYYSSGLCPKKGCSSIFQYSPRMEKFSCYKGASNIIKNLYELRKILRSAGKSAWTSGNPESIQTETVAKEKICQGSGTSLRSCKCFWKGRYLLRQYELHQQSGLFWDRFKTSFKYKIKLKMDFSIVVGIIIFCLSFIVIYKLLKNWIF